MTTPAVQSQQAPPWRPPPCLRRSTRPAPGAPAPCLRLRQPTARQNPSTARCMTPTAPTVPLATEPGPGANPGRRRARVTVRPASMRARPRGGRYPCVKRGMHRPRHSAAPPGMVGGTDWPACTANAGREGGGAQSQPARPPACLRRLLRGAASGRARSAARGAACGSCACGRAGAGRLACWRLVRGGRSDVAAGRRARGAARRGECAAAAGAANGNWANERGHASWHAGIRQAGIRQRRHACWAHGAATAGGGACSAAAKVMRGTAATRHGVLQRRCANGEGQSPSQRARRRAAGARRGARHCRDRRRQQPLQRRDLPLNTLRCAPILCVGTGGGGGGGTGVGAAQSAGATQHTSAPSAPPTGPR